MANQHLITKSEAWIGLHRVVLSIEAADVAWGDAVRGTLELLAARPAQPKSATFAEATVGVLTGDPNFRYFSQPSFTSQPLLLAEAAVRVLPCDGNSRFHGDTSAIFQTIKGDLARSFWGDILLSTGDPLCLPFSLKLPYGTSFDADVEVIGRLQPTVERIEAIAALGLRVLPPPEFIVLAAQLSRETQCGQVIWRNVGSSAEAILEPSRGVSSDWRRIRLHLLRAGETVRGRIDIERRSFSNLIRRASIRIPFLYSAAQVDEAGSFFRQVLMGLRSGSLPVPSQPRVTAAETYPLPADDTAGE